MKKMSLARVLEALFNPELPGPANAHQFTQTHPKGPSEFPYNHSEPTMEEEDIDQELKLEFNAGAGRSMRDPANLPNHRSHNGSFANGLASKAFGNYKLNSKEEDGFDPSMHEVEVRSIDVDNAGDNSDIPDEWKPFFEERDRAEAQASESKAKKRTDLTLWSAYKAPKMKKEDVGMREKGRAYGTPVSTTKQPFASGIPKATPNMEFYSDEDIDKELGLIEWISSSLLFNKKVHPAKADLDFFSLDPKKFRMNTEEEFNDNQKRRGKNAKRKKG